MKFLTLHFKKFQRFNLGGKSFFFTTTASKISTHELIACIRGKRFGELFTYLKNQNFFLHKNVGACIVRTGALDCALYCNFIGPATLADTVG